LHAPDYLYGHLGGNAQKQMLWKVPVSIALFGGASYIAWSRVRDHVHDTLDVLVGAGAGTTISLLVYGLHDNRFGAFYPPKRPRALHVRTSINSLYAECQF